MKYLFIMAVSIFFLACSKDGEAPVGGNGNYRITTFPADTIQLSVGLGGVVVPPPGTTAPTIVQGVCWSLKPGPTIEDSNITFAGPPAPFTITAASLRANTRYFARVFCKTSSVNAVYGNEINFTRQTTQTIGYASEAFNVTRTEASTLCTITETGGFTNWTVGVVYSSVTQKPEYSPIYNPNNFPPPEYAVGSPPNTTFTITMKSLTPNTVYYYKFYSLNGDYTSRPAKSFKTLP